MTELGPFNVSVMDLDKWVNDRMCLPVSAMLIREPSSMEFNAHGLFSEEIFGKVGTTERMLRHGYIELNTEIIAPIIYRTLVRMSALYQDIMSGRAYATWNEETKDFERYVGDPEDHPEANTGFSYFLQHYGKINLKTTSSISREMRVDLVDKYRGISLYSKYLVHPAGLRDIAADASGKLIQDDINKLYTTLLAYSSSIPKGSTSEIYDNIRFTIQSKCMEIYEYLLNTLTGKRGYYQGSYMSRHVACGTRNVISAASYSAPSPTHPQYLKPNESFVGIYQTIKALQPVVFHGFKKYFSEPIFGEYGTQERVPLINTKTLTMEYVEVPEKERIKFTSHDGINSFINNYGDVDTRERPITVKGSDRKDYYLALVYDDFDRIAYFSSIDDLKAKIDNPNMDKVRPLTWIELFYVLGFEAADGKVAFLTRYPVMGDSSCYPTIPHVTSTTPARVVNLVDLIAPDFPMRQYPEYPVLGRPHRDTVACHASRLAGLGGDHDGDRDISDVTYN